MKLKSYTEFILTEGKINEAKWKAAAELCEYKGWKWQILTEDTLNNTK